MTGKVCCARCGEDLTNISNENSRAECPVCHSTDRECSEHVSDSFKLRDGKKAVYVKPELRSKDKKRAEEKSQPDIRRADNTPVYVIRVSDRDRDIYVEVVIDFEAREVTRCAVEKLSEHIGHGSAKFKENP